VYWEVLVCAAKADNEMIFEGADGLLGGILAMHVQ
jgi:hypothetical protein